MMKPDYDNAIYYPDKGRGKKEPLKASKFREGNGAPIEDPRKAGFPGPGQYGVEGKIEATTHGPKAPAYSMNASGRVDLGKLH
jgi:hypothetical protein